MKLTVYTDGLEGFAKRSRTRARKLDRAERIAPSFGFTFESPMQMFEVLTAQRVRLVELARTKPYSIAALARELGRDPKSVRRDVAKLEEYRLIRTREQINPGHGRVKIVEATAKSFELRTQF
jgi:predicted transcriptional regulator